MRKTLLIVAAGLVIAVPAASAPRVARSASPSSFFLQCRLSNASVKEGERVEPQISNYTFEVSLRDMQVRDLVLSGFPYTISKASSGRIDAVNNASIYANSLARGSDKAHLTINRISGSTNLSFYHTPSADEIRSCKAKSGNDDGWYCEYAYAVVMQVGTCSIAKPKF